MATSGVGSSLDTVALVSAMMKPYEAKVSTFNKNISSYNVKLTELGKVKSAFSDLKTSLQSVEKNQLSPLTTDKLKEAFKTFVTEYNDAASVSKNSSDYSIRRSFGDIRKDLDPNTYMKLGLSFDKNGLLSFDETKFDTLATTDSTALNNYANTIFDSALESTSGLNNMVAFGGNLDTKETTLKEKISKLEDERDLLENKMPSYEASYTKKFNELQRILDSLSINENAISNMMASLNNKN